MQEQYNQFKEVLNFYNDRKDEGKQELILLLLQEAQSIFGFVPLDIQNKIAEFLDVKTTTITALIKRIPTIKGEFYKHKITVCSGPRCGAKGGSFIIDAVEKELHVKPGHVTRDSRFLYTTQNCLKKCGVGPNMYIDDVLYSNLKAEDLKEIFSNY